MNDPNTPTPDERAVLAAFSRLPGPQPLFAALVVLNPLPAGRARLRLFAARNPWRDRNRELGAVADALAGCGLLTLTRPRRLPLAGEYEITDAGLAALASTQTSTPNGA